MINNEYVLEFEKPIAELEKKIEEMREYSIASGVELSDDVKRLEKKAKKLREDIYSSLTRWQRVQIARHPNRPYTQDYIDAFVTNFTELHGDRLFSDDNAMISGIGFIEDLSCVIIGQQKGRDTKENLKRNFGMVNPEGYRKALRIMKIAERFNKPIVTLIDTPGAYPGLGAEERGQAEAIARNLFDMSCIKVPIVSIVIGEGASGGALGIAVSDQLLMLENAWFSVISPEGCAAILWRDSSKVQEAAEAMKLSAQDLLKQGVIDSVVEEPLGGAHTNYEKITETVKNVILKSLKELLDISPETLVEKRINRLSKIGAWVE